jgi:CrcB protein
MAHVLELLSDAAVVTAGATFGTPARFYLSGIVARRVGETFPWGTFVVNVSGCLVMGIVAAFARAHGLSGSSLYWLLAATGFLGSYTTVSSFALQTRALMRDGQLRLAAIYALLSLISCLAAVGAGFGLAMMALAGDAT